MAIDTQVALGGKQFAGADGGGKTLSDYAMDSVKIASMGQSMLASKQQIESSKAQQALAEAQLPGVQAESAGKVYEQKYRDFLQNNGQNFYDTHPETGQKTFNATKAFDLMAQGGFLGKARQGMSEDLANKISDIAVAQGNIKTESDQLNVSKKKADLVQDAIGKAAIIVAATPPAQRDAALGDITSKLDTAYGQFGMGKAVRDGLTIATPVLDANGQPVIDPKTGQPKVDTKVNPDAVAARRQATMDVSTANSVEQTNILNKATLERYGQSPESNDSGSTLSGQARATLKAQGIDIPDNMTYRQALQLYGDKLTELATNDIMTKEMKMTQKEKIAAAQMDLSAYKEITKAAEKSDSKTLGTRAGTMGSNAWKKYIESNPEFAGLGTAIARYNAMHPNDAIDTAKLTVGEITAKLKEAQALREGDLKIHSGNMGPKVTSGSGAAGAPAQPAADASGKVRVKSPDGKVGSIPAARLEEYKRNGFTEVK